jgi:hypothetical protein
MSFSVSFTSKKSEVNQHLTNNRLPAPVAEYILAGIEHFQDEARIEVSAFGHLFDGNVGNFQVTSATISVRPVTP